MTPFPTSNSVSASHLPANKEEHFNWDAAGNQTDRPGETVWRNLLLRLKGARWRYDGFGRMTWRKSSASAVEQHFSYDDEHRISEVRFDGHKEFSRAEYRYDVLGRRTQKILHRHGRETEVISFLWSGLRMVGESSSLQPARNTQYIYGENSWEPLARVDSIGEQSDVFWYHTELNGLPERMTDEHGEVVWRGRFSTWGETERESVTGFQAVQQNLRFQGQYLDRESGLHYNLFRYYDPVGGRFTQVDPIGLAGGINTYGYVGDPLTWVDPLGWMSCSTDAAKLARNLGPQPLGGGKYDAHHIVMSNSSDPRMVALRKRMDDLNIDINNSKNGVWLPNTRADRIDGTLTTAHKGNGIHGNAYKQYVYDRLINGQTDEEFLTALKSIKSELASGKVFPLANGKFPIL